MPTVSRCCGCGGGTRAGAAAPAPADPASADDALPAAIRGRAMRLVQDWDFARTVTHYWGDGHFLGEGGDEGVVLRDAPQLAGIPGTLVQGSLDFGNLAGIVWRLHHAWPASELVVVDDAGHTPGAPGMTEALVAATDKYARRRP